MEACLRDQLKRCVTECTATYGYSYQACAGQLCSPNSAVNLREWAGNCRTRTELARDECRDGLASCRDTCD